MGRILSVEEIQTGHIPEPGAHETAANFLMSALFDYDSMPAQAAVVYGSTALGVPNYRSDLDIFVRTNDPVAVARIYGEAEAVFKIKVESHTVPGSFFMPTLPIDPFFVDHLKTAQENPRWSKNWPIMGYAGTDAYTEEQLRARISRYCAGKATTFTQAQVDYRGEPNLHTLQRAFELPLALARKIISFERGVPTDLRDNAGLTGDFLLRLASEEATNFQGSTYGVSDPLTLNQLDRHGSDRQRKPHTRTTDKARQLVRLNLAYDALLAETLRTQDTSTYSDWLAEQYNYALILAGHVAATCSDTIQRPISDVTLEEIAAGEARIDDLDY
ncbi:hypothetical protein EYC59_00240 [Candidatus Saccharibacteria bacterium]|nr:MAG: hypothetical protein EYC59_00240 [Candidatus Saccharibacteria bacterium]